MSRALVTGGSGYLGTQLAAALLRGGRQGRVSVGTGLPPAEGSHEQCPTGR